MYSTYRLMCRGTNSIYLNKTLEELVDDFRNSKSNEISKRNKIVAAMFIKVFPMILKIQSKYYNLTNEQKVDHALFHLVRSIKYYNKSSSKFSSFFYTHLSNQMKSLLSSQNSLKNAVFQNLVADNEETLNRYIDTESDNNNIVTENYFLQDMYNSSQLSTEEKEYCACILAGYTTPKLIANKMYNTPLVQSPINISKIKKDLKKIKSIKDSIKQKMDKWGEKERTRVFF